MREGKAQASSSRTTRYGRAPNAWLDSAVDVGVTTGAPIPTYSTKTLTGVATELLLTPLVSLFRTQRLPEASMAALMPGTHPP